MTDYNEMLDGRRMKGLEIAKAFHIVRRGEDWIVPSQTGKGTYRVTVRYDKEICTCPDFEKRGIKCKHMFAIEYSTERNMDENGNIITTKRVTYAQEWSAYDKAQTQQKELFLRLLRDICYSIPQQQYTFGRPTLPLSDMVFASALKVFTTFSLRRFESDIRMAKEKGYVDKTPCFASVGHFMQNPQITPILKSLIMISSLPLKSVETDFAIDSSGFTTTRFARWFDYKWGKEKDVRVWIKAHVMSGTKTGIITATEVRTTHEADIKFLPKLLAETNSNFTVKELAADKAYLSKNNLELVNSIGATPYIPFKVNSNSRARGSPMWKKMYYYFQYRHDEFLQHYHKRSNAETVFHMIKSKFGSAVRSKNKTAQVNEVLLKVLCHNICVVIQEMHELGILPDFCTLSQNPAPKVGGETLL